MTRSFDYSKTIQRWFLVDKRLKAMNISDKQMCNDIEMLRL